MPVLDEFLQLCAGEITRRASSMGQPVLVEGAAAFQAAVNDAQLIDTELSTIGAQQCLAQVAPDTASNPAIAERAIQAAKQVPWQPTTRLPGDDGSAVGLGLIDKARSFGANICGLMLVSPGARYPEHTHPPQELYLPIYGDGQWRFGGSDDYTVLAHDTLVYNNPSDLHGMTAGASPELALYFLWP